MSRCPHRPCWYQCAVPPQMRSSPTNIQVETITVDAYWTYERAGHVIFSCAYLYCRYFVRRRIDTMRSSAPFAAGGVALTLWQGLARNASRGRDWWATTAVMPSTAGYSRVGTIGAVLVTGGVNRQRLVDCYISAWGDHMVGLERECMVGKPGNTAGLRTLGFALDDAGAAAANAAGVATVSLFRCFDNVTKNHAVSTESDCRGRGVTEFSLGHILAYTPSPPPHQLSASVASEARRDSMSDAAARTSKVSLRWLFLAALFLAVCCRLPLGL